VRAACTHPEVFFNFYMGFVDFNNPIKLGFVEMSWNNRDERVDEKRRVFLKIKLSFKK
jgi:hypothetical protein